MTIDDDQKAASTSALVNANYARLITFLIDLFMLYTQTPAIVPFFTEITQSLAGDLVTTKPDELKTAGTCRPLLHAGILPPATPDIPWLKL